MLAPPRLRPLLTVAVTLLVVVVAVARAAEPLARVRTLAYVVMNCHQLSNGHVEFTQKLEVQRGDDAPTTLWTIGPITTKPPLGTPPLCGFGNARVGSLALSIGPFQRLGVSPDGRTVVYELAEPALWSQIGISVDEVPGLGQDGLGFFAVRDGGPRLRLGCPSADPTFRTHGLFGAPSVAGPLAFDPDGNRVVFSDLETQTPDCKGSAAPGDAPQAVVMSTTTGEWRTVTALPPPPGGGANIFMMPETVFFPFFLDARTVAFGTVADTSGLRRAHPKDQDVQIPAGTFVGVEAGIDGTDVKVFDRFVPASATSKATPIFAVEGHQHLAAVIPLPGAMPMNKGAKPGYPVQEVFVFDHDNVLQLTALNRVDTATAVMRPGGRRVFFASSHEEGNTCQIFSVPVLGGRLRQLTHLAGAPAPPLGCSTIQQPGCTALIIAQDAVTGAVIFYSTCDPLGTNPDGAQVYAIRPDGRGLRQLTHFAGMTQESDGSRTLELPWPVAYSAPVGP